MLSKWIPPISFGAKVLLRRKWNPNPNPNSASMQWFSVSSSEAVIDMAARDGELRVFLVAGEVSGDSIASRRMASLKILSPFPLRFAGVGGAKMATEGLQSLFPIEDISVWDFGSYCHICIESEIMLYANREMAFVARHSQKMLHSPVHCHYVAPSFWAWKGGEARLRGLAELVDHLLCIPPNEDKICGLNGLYATFVGHPVLEGVLELNLRNNSSIHEWRAEGNGEDFRSKHAVPAGATVISLLPGSRVQELSRMLPSFSNTVELMKDMVPQLMTVINVAPNEHVENFITGAVHRWPVPVLLIPGGTTQLRYDAFSLQLARLAYRAHILTEWFIRYKAKIQYISLPNILLDKAIVPEALFQYCKPANLALLLKDLIDDKGCREEQIIAAQKFVKLLLPSERIKDNLPQQNLRTYADYTPSAVAALTILNHGKPMTNI
ncbi:Lipid-A-disaccharide synthase [Spatholobus suberectus]|nr:Lipid-A-disaccharide synthase [Spatholobus suberectus]